MTKREKTRAGLQFAIVMSVFNVAMNLLMETHISTEDYVRSILIGLLAGLVSGILFGWLIGLVAGSKYFTRSISLPTLPGETVILKSPANRFHGIEAVGGVLALTDQRLIFQSHSINLQVQQFSIHRDDIESAVTYRPLKISNKGLAVTLIDGTLEKFVVDKPEKWVRELMVNS